jgi:hypothetical protein
MARKSSLANGQPAKCRSRKPLPDEAIVVVIESVIAEQPNYGYFQATLRLSLAHTLCNSRRCLSLRNGDASPKTNCKEQQSLGLPVREAFKYLGKILELEGQFRRVVRNEPEIAAKCFLINISLIRIVSNRSHKLVWRARDIQFVKHPLQRSNKKLRLT